MVGVVLFALRSCHVVVSRLPLSHWWITSAVLHARADTGFDRAREGYLYLLRSSKSGDSMGDSQVAGAQSS